MSHQPDLFRGTAWYYARYRPPYHERFFSEIRRHFALDGSGRLLDLGCGTGNLALPLAPWFADVIGIDREPEMLEEAARLAREAGIGNVTWVRGSSSDLGELGPRLGRLRLVTIGRAFHWMDGDATLRELDTLVEPEGGVVIVGDTCGLWGGDEPWKTAITEVIQRWLGETRRAGSGAFNPPPDRHEGVLARSPFAQFEELRFRFGRDWDLDGVAGHLYSTSFCSPALLGERQAGFDADLRATLLALQPDGVFHEEVELEAFFARRAE